MGDLGLLPGMGKSPGEGNGNSLQYSGLENSMDREARKATVHGVAKSWTRLRDLLLYVESAYSKVGAQEMEAVVSMTVMLDHRSSFVRGFPDPTLASPQGWVAEAPSTTLLVRVPLYSAEMSEVLSRHNMSW